MATKAKTVSDERALYEGKKGFKVTAEPHVIEYFNEKLDADEAEYYLKVFRKIERKEKTPGKFGYVRSVSGINLYEAWTPFSTVQGFYENDGHFHILIVVKVTKSYGVPEVDEAEKARVRRALENSRDINKAIRGFSLLRQGKIQGVMKTHHYKNPALLSKEVFGGAND